MYLLLIVLQGSPQFGLNQDKYIYKLKYFRELL